MRTSIVDKIDGDMVKTSIQYGVDKREKAEVALHKLAISQKESFVKVEMDMEDDIAEELSPPPHLSTTGQMNIFVSEISDNEYTFPPIMAKTLIEDHGGSELQPIFDISPLLKEEEKDP